MTMYAKNKHQSREYGVSSERVTAVFIGVGALTGSMLALISNGRYLVDFACCAIALTMVAVLYMRHRNLAFFSVRLQGDQICVPSELPKPYIGFFITLFVTASSADEAGQKAKSLVLNDWKSGRFAAVGSSAPRLAIMEVSKTGMFTWLMAMNAKYGFYPPHDEEL